MVPRGSLFLPWLVLASVCTALMALAPGDETIPYHVAWIGVALAYGVDPWPLRLTLVALGAYTVATGAILLVRTFTGVIAWEETTEIPLMATLVLLSLWHVRRRQDALAELTRIAERDRVRSGQRERLSRMTSHEMRTPLTIAGGYVELLLDRELDPDDREDLLVVQDELGRLNRTSGRLLRLMELQEEDAPTPADIDFLLHQVANRWSTVADRRWLVRSALGTRQVSVERIRAAMDTLIENALRHTVRGDVVRLTAFERDGAMHIGVADSGSGVSEELRQAINRQDVLATQRLSVQDPSRSGVHTGLGLGIVQEVVAMRSGRLVAETAAEGGACILMVFPPEMSAARPGNHALEEHPVPV